MYKKVTVWDASVVVDSQGSGSITVGPKELPADAASELPFVVAGPVTDGRWHIAARGLTPDDAVSAVQLVLKEQLPDRTTVRSLRDSLVS